MVMEHKGIKVNCPFCKGTLWIDPATGEILYKEKAKKDFTKTLDDFLTKTQEKDKILEDKFKRVQEKEATKLDRLEKKFDWAKEHKDELPEPPKPII